MGEGLGKDKKGRVEPVPVIVLPPGKSLDHCMRIKEKKLGVVVCLFYSLIGYLRQRIK